ncbi:hypothetical protein [Bacillus solitudinis]|uniref:hypothetical protein n=1 Tax=Bacillus solitudinis TaxID=2014074 RepID=UPI000C2315E1|nr:hypothetical protein [Bacillus solitudinis]
MTEAWKLDNEYYVIYTESKDIIRRIKRYYKDFPLMAEYQKGNKVFAKQYRVPIKRKRVAQRLARLI